MPRGRMGFREGGWSGVQRAPPPPTHPSEEPPCFFPRWVTPSVEYTGTDTGFETAPKQE